jgi:hypothetical protein
LERLADGGVPAMLHISSCMWLCCLLFIIYIFQFFLLRQHTQRRGTVRTLQVSVCSAVTRFAVLCVFYITLCIFHIILCDFILFCVLFYIILCNFWVYMCTNHCHRVFTQLQLANISIISIIIIQVNSSSLTNSGTDTTVWDGVGGGWGFRRLEKINKWQLAGIWNLKLKVIFKQIDAIWFSLNIEGGFYLTARELNYNIYVTVNLKPQY